MLLYYHIFVPKRNLGFVISFKMPVSKSKPQYCSHSGGEGYLGEKNDNYYQIQKYDNNTVYNTSFSYIYRVRSTNIVQNMTNLKIDMIQPTRGCYLLKLQGQTDYLYKICFKKSI